MIVQDLDFPGFDHTKDESDSFKWQEKKSCLGGSDLGNFQEGGNRLKNLLEHLPINQGLEKKFSGNPEIFYLFIQLLLLV